MSLICAATEAHAESQTGSSIATEPQNVRPDVSSEH